jgi:hypothetical protein
LIKIVSTVHVNLNLIYLENYYCENQQHTSVLNILNEIRIFKKFTSFQLHIDVEFYILIKTQLFENIIFLIDYVSSIYINIICTTFSSFNVIIHFLNSFHIKMNISIQLEFQIILLKILMNKYLF